MNSCVGIEPSLFRVFPGAFARCPALRVCATASRMTGGAQASGAGGQAARMATAVERALQMTTPIRKRFAFFALEKPNGFPAATKACTPRASGPVPDLERSFASVTGTRFGFAASAQAAGDRGCLTQLRWSAHVRRALARGSAKTQAAIGFAISGRRRLLWWGSPLRGTQRSCARS